MVVGIGTDIIEIERIDKAVLRTKSFLNKVYTHKEQMLWESKGKKVTFLAGNFAAKEAVSKALGTGFRTFGLCDVEILRDELGKPEVVLHGDAKKIFEQIGVSHIFVSISHCKHYATAMVILER
ncbi:MAG: holo-ACP synthase [Cellulosilyticaceae bacterium]